MLPIGHPRWACSEDCEHEYCIDIRRIMVTPCEVCKQKVLPGQEFELWRGKFYLLVPLHADHRESES